MRCQTCTCAPGDPQTEGRPRSNHAGNHSRHVASTQSLNMYCTLFAKATWQHAFLLWVFWPIVDALPMWMAAHSLYPGIACEPAFLFELMCLKHLHTVSCNGTLQVLFRIMPMVVKIYWLWCRTWQTVCLLPTHSPISQLGWLRM